MEKSYIISKINKKKQIIMNKKNLYESIMRSVSHEVKKSLNEMAKTNSNNQNIDKIKKMIIDFYQRAGLNPYAKEVKAALGNLYKNWEVREIIKDLNLQDILKRSLTELCTTGTCNLSKDEREFIISHIKENLQWYSCDSDSDYEINVHTNMVANRISDYIDSIKIMDIFETMPETLPYYDQIQDYMDDFFGNEGLYLLEIIIGGEAEHIDGDCDTYIYELCEIG